MSHPASLPDEPVEAIRRFNRFYTRQIELLREGLLDSPFSLAEARIIYEIASRERSTAVELAASLGLDQGYLSRMLRGFEQRGLIRRQVSESDARQAILALTDAGREAFALLNSRSRQQVSAMLGKLTASQRDRLIAAMAEIENLLGAQPENRVPYLIRPHQIGDLGWIVHRHAVLYAQEFGWNEEFEALAAEVAASFIRNFKPKRDCCWIAERDGRIVGSAAVVDHGEGVAKLRLVYVEPTARGLGIGERLVAECMRFARQAGYRRMTLWTHNVLLAARRIYEKAGFTIVANEPHHSFGHDLVSEIWERDL